MKNKIKKALYLIGLGIIFQNPTFGQTTKLIYGSDHTTIGNANITVSNRQTIISNIGTTGADGVRINFLDGEYHTDLAQQEYPDGAKVRFELFGTLNGLNEKISEATILSTSTGKKIIPDFNAVGSEFYTIEIYDGASNLVARRTGLKDPTVILNSDPAQRPKLRTCWHKKYDSNGNVTGYYFSVWIDKDGDNDPNNRYLLPTGEEFTGGMAIYISEAPIKLPYAYNFANIYASGVPSITIDDEWLIKHELISYTAFDETRFTTQGQDITVNNDLNATTFKTRMEFLPFLNGQVSLFDSKIDLGLFSSLPNSAEIKYSQNILVNKLPVIVSNITFDKTGNGFNIDPDFSPVGSFNYNASGLLNGQIVTSDANISKETSIKSLSGNSWVNTPISNVIWGLNNITVSFMENIRVKFGNGPWTTVNQIKFEAISPNNNYPDFAFIDIVTSNISSYILKDGQYANSSSSSRFLNNSSVVELESLNFSVFPNPADNLLQINNADNVKSFSLYDMNGKQLHSVKSQISDNRIEIDLTNINSGVYFISIDNGVSVTVKKLIVSK